MCALIRSGVGLGEGELGEVFVRECWCGNGAQVGFVEALKGILYLLLLRRRDRSCLTVVSYVYA